jgi:modulator of FtsH protease HflK
MPWKNQGGGGGPWGGGQGPWGGGGSGGGGNKPPDFEDMLRRGQDRMRRLLPGGFGSGRSLFLIVLAGVALWLATGFYRVGPEEEGVALIFGRVWKLTQPGLNYNLPAPIGEVLTPKVTRINQVEIGFRSTLEAQGNPSQDVEEESLMLTGDENIIDMQFVVLWKIQDPEKYLFSIRDPDNTVKNVAESVMREIIGQTEFERARTIGRSEIEQEAHKRIQKLLDSYQSGILVTQVKMQNIAPPSATIDAFRDVQAASADKDRMVNEAQAYYNEVTQRAAGEAQQYIKAAEAYREQTVVLATGEAQRFETILTQYRKAKEITERRLYLETMEQLLKNMNKVLVDSKLNGALPYLSLNELMKRTAPPAAKSGGGGNQ